MSLKNYFSVKRISRSSFKKDYDDESFQFDNDESLLKSVIDPGQPIHSEPNSVDPCLDKANSSIEIANFEEFPTELNKDKCTTKFNKKAEKPMKTVESDSEVSQKSKPEKTTAKPIKTRSKKSEHRLSLSKSFSSSGSLRQTLLAFEKREDSLSHISVSESSIMLSHEDSGYKTQQADTELELITSKVSSLTINLTDVTEQSADFADISSLIEHNETFRDTSQETQDIALITSNLSTLQLDKEETSIDLSKSHLGENNLSFIEKDDVLKQNSTSDNLLTSKSFSIQSSETFKNSDLNEEELINFEYDDDNSVHFHYSVDVFEENISTVLKSESFLFSEPEIQWWKLYNNLSLYSKHLFVRLYIRKYAWFKQDQLTKYIPNDEIFNECIEELVESELFISASPKDIPLEDTLKELTLPVIKDIVRETLYKKIKLTGNKATIIASILKAVGKTPGYSKFFNTPKKPSSPLETSVIEACTKLVGRLLAINKEAWKFFNLVNRVYTHYGERYEQSVITESLRSRIRNVGYINYHVSRSGKVFPSRKNLQDFDRAITLMKSISFTFNSSLQNSSKYQIVCKRIERVLSFWRYALQQNYSNYKSSYFLRFTPAFVYTKLINIYYLPSLAKLKLYSEEVEIIKELLDQSMFLQNERGKWWSRLCLVQASHLSKEDENYRKLAYENCVKALHDTVNNGIDSESANEIYNRMVKLEKRLKIPEDEHCNLRDPRPQTPPEFTIYAKSKSVMVNKHYGKPVWIIEETGEKLHTEEFALHYFTQMGWKGYHSENKIFTTLFALLFLDILFLPLPGAFETPFQTHPLDFGTEAFYLDRKPHIEARLKKIESESFEELISTHYIEHSKQKSQVIGLSWMFELSDLIQISNCIGGETLSKIFKLFCQNYFSYNSGMPDLCIWNPEEKICEFIEVKALSDTLSEKQKNWLGFLMNCGINVKVCLLKDSSSSK